MAKVRYTVRLYRLHDLDLITFIMTHEFDVMRAIYSSITAFAKGEYFIIQIPDALHTELPQLRYSYTKALTLDTEKDRAAIEMINKIQPGKRNNFFKSLLRLYLVHPFSETFFTDPADMALFEEKLSAMRSGQREVRAGKVKKVTTRRRKMSNEESEAATTAMAEIIATHKEYINQERVKNKTASPQENSEVAKDVVAEDNSENDASTNKMLDFFGGLSL